MLENMIRWLRSAPLGQAVAVLLAENVLVLIVALAMGHWLVARYRDRRVALPPSPLEPTEVAVTVATVFLNTVVTLLGLLLWRAGIIRFRTDVGWRAWLDIPILLVVMDFAMYVLHRLAHHRLFFAMMHRLHHDYDRPRPLTLFILNPAETLSFGALWLAVIAASPFSWFGMSIYLVLNVVFGTIGHLGVEPVPKGWSRIPVLRSIAGSTFHARHHQDIGCNFGFYTLIWDRLFGTLRPDYWATFGEVPGWVAEPNETEPPAAHS